MQVGILAFSFPLGFVAHGVKVIMACVTSSFLLEPRRLRISGEKLLATIRAGILRWHLWDHF